MTNKQGQTQRERRARYTPNQAFTNSFAAHICGIKPTLAQSLISASPPGSIVHQIIAADKAIEADRIRADLVANVDKAEKVNQRDEAAALAMQIDYQEKTGAV